MHSLRTVMRDVGAGGAGALRGWLMSMVRMNAHPTLAVGVRGLLGVGLGESEETDAAKGELQRSGCREPRLLLQQKAREISGGGTL